MPLYSLKNTKSNVPTTRNSQKSSVGLSPKRTFVVLVVASALLFTVYSREGNAGPLHLFKSGYSYITTPFKYAGSVIAYPFTSLGQLMHNATASQKSLSQLEEENKKLTAELTSLQESNLAGQRLEALLKLKGTYNLNTIGGRIIAQSTDSWSNTITIDRGTTSGVAIGMPVLDTTGVIGQVAQVSKNSSVVRLITDENSKVSAMIQKSRIQGMLKGSVNGVLTLTLIPVESEVKVGDIVITSGLGGIYPKGLPLGKVASIEKPDGAIYSKIVVDPLSSVKNAEEVLIVLGIEETKDTASQKSGDTSDKTTTKKSDKDVDKTDKKSESKTSDDSFAKDDNKN